MKILGAGNLFRGVAYAIARVCWSRMILLNILYMMGGEGLQPI